MTHTHRLISAAVLAMALTGLAVSTLAQQTTTDAVGQNEQAAAAPTAPAPDYKTARDVFLKTKKFKTPAEQLARAKEFLTALMTISSARLNALKDRLTASDMTPDQMDSAAAEISKAESALDAVNANIANAATRADLAKAFTEAKGALKLVRFAIKRQAIAFKLQRLGVVIERLQTALEGAETKINDLKIAGAPTAAAVTELADIKGKLSTIATSRRTASGAIDALSIDKDFEAIVNSAESVAAKIALSLRAVINSAQTLAGEIKTLTPAPAEDKAQPATGASGANQ